MVEVEISEGTLRLEVKGFDKLWALKSSLSIPIAHVRGVRHDPEVARGWYKGLRAPGTHVPGAIVAGTFYQDGKRVFWDVHRAANTIVIDLADERYDQLIVEVADPAAAVARISEAIGGSPES